MKEEGQGDRSRANYQIRSDLNVEFGDHKIGQTCFMMTADDMKLCNDAAILEEAAKTAIELCGETRRWFTANKIRRIARRNALIVGDLIIEIIKLRKEVQK